MVAGTERWLPGSATADSKRLLVTHALRGLGDGAVSVILPSYLVGIGFSALQVSAIVFGTLLGSALLTLWVGLATDRLGRRRVLMSACILMLATGLGFASVTGFWSLFTIAVVGTLNPSSGDVSLFLPVEHASLSQTTPVRDLTRMFALYNVAGAMSGAVGALMSAMPALLARRFGCDLASAQRAGFFAYAMLSMTALFVYWGLTPAIEAEKEERTRRALEKSRAIVARLSILFSLDSLGGGFVIQSLLALWLFRRYQISPGMAGAFFFAAGLLGSLSQFVSSALANRFGRINTMVFTHIPSNVFLILAAVMPSAVCAMSLLLARFSISQMDVPARQSYVMAMVPPEERAGAASVTNVPRSLASALAPLPAGMMLERSTFGWPLICAGVLKIAYDFLLLAQFRALKPADETH